MMEEEVWGYTVDDFAKDMRSYNLSCKQPDIRNKLYVFWIKEGEEEEEEEGTRLSLQKNPFLLYTVDPPLFVIEAFTKKWRNVKEYLKSVLSEALKCENVCPFNFLIQFWAPTTMIGGCRVLTTSNHPFCLHHAEIGLWKYVKHSLTLKLNVLEYEDDELSGNGNIIERVFKHKQKKTVKASQRYTSKDHRLSDFAQECGITSASVLPLFIPFGRCCAGVLELVTTSRDSLLWCGDLDILAFEIFEVGNTIFPLPPSLKESENVVTDQMNKALQIVCTRHQLPLAQIWIPCCTSTAFAYVDSPYYSNSCYSPYLGCSDKFSSSYKNCNAYNYNRLKDFNLFCQRQTIRKGQSCVGKAFLSSDTYLCSDVTQLPITECPLFHKARVYGLTGCFAIFLHSISHTKNYDYVLELYLPPWETVSGDLQSFSDLILETVKNEFSSFKIGFEDDGLLKKETSEAVKNNGKTATLPPPIPASSQKETLVEQSIECPQVPINDDEPYPTVVSGNTRGQPIPEPFAKDKETIQNIEIVGETITNIALDIFDSKRNGIVEAAINDGKIIDISPVPELQSETEVVHPLDDESTMDVVNENEVNEREGVELSNDESTEEAIAQKKSNMLVAEHNDVAAVVSSKRICREAKSKTGYEANKLCRNDPEQHVVKKLGHFTHRCGVGNKGMEVSEQSIASVPSSRWKKASREDITKSLYMVKDKKITVEDLLEIKHMKRKEAAEWLGISLGSLQNACRHFGIMRWPPESIGNNASSTSDARNTNQEQEEDVVMEKRKKVNNDIPSACDLMHVKEGVLNKRKKANPSCSNPIPNVPVQNDAGSVTAYVTYVNQTVRFQLPLSSGKMDLRNKVTERYPLAEVTFDINYLDDKKRWILIAHDDDVKECIRISRSLGEEPAHVEMMILPTTNQAP